MTRYGAQPEDWQHLDALGLGSDLLPVVSRPDAEISPKSTMKQLGKTPSLYNGGKRVVGIARWTEHRASDAELKRWMAEPDYGVCIITRHWRALDIDVSDLGVVTAISRVVRDHLGEDVPCRSRDNSPKCLFPFVVEGDLAKRVMRVEGGMIEFLATGQQFIAHGTHPSGVRYKWNEPLHHVRTLTLEQFEALWADLEIQFAIEPPTISKLPVDGQRGEHLDVEDPVADWLEAEGLVASETRRGALVITCPWADEHSSDTDGSTSTVWFRAGTNGHPTGHFKCAHAHCEHRNRSDFLAKVGYPDDRADDFEVVPDPDEEEQEGETFSTPLTRNPFKLLTVREFLDRPRPGWVIKGLMPQADLGVVYGASGAGKSFIMLELVMAIVRGIPWRGLRVRQGKVVYICAEGAGGFRNRVEAYCQHHGIDGGALPLLILDAVPNLLDVKQVKALAETIEQEPDVALIVCDTFAQMTPGANENAGEDMGLAIGHIRHVGRKVGAVTVLVHHSGKDAAKGARGWSGIRAAADFEMEVTRDGENRTLNTTKQKDADDQASWGFRLQEMIIAIDDDGDDVKSAVVVENDVHVEAGVRGGSRVGAAKVKFGPWEQAVLDTYQELAVGGDVLRTEIVLRAADKMDKPESIKIRRATALRALKKLCDRGPKKRFAMVEDFVIEETN
jgi:hypothetical protein